MKKQEVRSYIGVYMDHAAAKLVDPYKTPSIIQVIYAEATGRLRIDGESGNGIQLGGNRSTNNEYSKHNKKQQELAVYYKQLAAALQKYNEILIFGPTTAQKEFLNYLLKEKSFDAKLMTTAEEDYMTENQVAEYVKKKLK